MKKKILSTLLTFAMLFSSVALFTVNLVADTAASTAIPIYDEEDLKNMSMSGNYILVKDITLSADWTPLGTFTGTLDGNGYSIYNLNLEYAPSDASNATLFVGGLFSVLTGATVKKLNIYGKMSVNANGAKYLGVGGITGRAFDSAAKQARVENCNSFVDIHVTTSATVQTYVGGIIGQVRNGGAYLQDCVNYGDIQSDGTAFVGGCAGYVTIGTTSFTNCANYGEISVTVAGASVGGCVACIASDGNTEVTISNFENHGDLNAVANTNIGGCVGLSGKTGSTTVATVATIDGAKNYGSISATGSSGIARLGGCVGYAAYGSTFSLTNCVNFGATISEQTAGSAGAVGGIVAQSETALTVSYSANIGALTTTINNLVGGVLGYGHAGTASISYCGNVGVLTGNTSGVVGGIVGRVVNGATGCAATVKNCYQGGSIDAGAYKGGIVGNPGDANSTWKNCVAIAGNNLNGYGSATLIDTSCVRLSETPTQQDLTDALTKLNTGAEGGDAFRLNWSGDAIEPLYDLTRADVTVIGCQIKKETNSYAVRFVSAVSSLDFKTVGYEVRVTGDNVDKSADLCGTTVYSAIYETVNGKDERVDAPYGCAFYTATVDGISNTYDKLTFVVTPYVLVDGETEPQKGSEVTFVFNDGVLVDSQK